MKVGLLAQHLSLLEPNHDGVNISLILRYELMTGREAQILCEAVITVFSNCSVRKPG